MKKIALCPCNGVGKNVSAVIRQSMKVLKERLGDEIDLLDTVELAVCSKKVKQRLPSIDIVAVDGCSERCSSGILLRNNIDNFWTIYVPKIMSENRLSMAGIKRECIGEHGVKVANKLADIIYSKIKNLKKTNKVFNSQVCQLLAADNM